MHHLKVSGAVLPLKWLLGIKWLIKGTQRLTADKKSVECILKLCILQIRVHLSTAACRHSMHKHVWILFISAKRNILFFAFYQMFHEVSYPSRKLQLLISVSLRSHPVAIGANVLKTPPSISLHLCFLCLCLGSQQTLWIPVTKGSL